MSALPAAYSWLHSLSPLPRMVDEALELYGVLEAPGAADNPTIMAWAREVGQQRVYTADSVAWCGLFMSVVAKRAGYQPPESPLWALNWRKFGAEAGQPELGDVLVFTRSGGGHVTLYVGEDRTAYHCLGGNQGDRVSIVRIDKKRLSAARSPIFKVGKPATVRPYVLAAAGALSADEA